MNVTTGRHVMVESLETRALFAVPDDFVQELIAGGLASPTSMTAAPDGRIFFTQQGGAVRVIKDGQLLSTPFATLPAFNEGESGLLGIALDPKFEQNGFVYVYYTTLTPTLHNRVSRLTASGVTGDVAVAGSEVHLFDQATLSQRRNHDGGAIKFGPDGKLYIGVGDSTLGYVSQELTNTMGKILRINADGSIPADNPFYNGTTGPNRAIWALGLRNPFSIAFQPGTGRMHINDVGHVGDLAWEEVNLGVAGANYGWPGIEGPRTAGELTPAGYRDPYFAYVHGPNAVNGKAITGGVFYNPPATATRSFPANYRGDYFYLDIDSYIRTLEPDGVTVSPFATEFSQACGLEVAPDGSILYLQRGRNGAPSGVFRIRYIGPNAPPGLLTQPTHQRVSVGEAAEFSASATGTGPLQYQWMRDDVEIPNATGATYTIASPTLVDNGARFAVRVNNLHGAVVSDLATLTVETNLPPVPVIHSPALDSVFIGGQSVAFSGSASDPDQGALANAALTWSVSYFTGPVERPSVPAFSGQPGGTFVPDTHTPYLGTDVKYRIYLTATDAAGRQATTYRDVVPVVGAINLQVEVADVATSGFTLNLDGIPKQSPSSDSTVAGLIRQISAPASQVVGGVTYDFIGWSDGGAASHDITATGSTVTFTADYAVRPATAIAKVNFQPGGAPAVAGYLIDAGLTFASRNGRQYGWNVSHADAVFDRNCNASQLIDTHAAVKAGGKWEIALPNGGYTVKVGVGDSSASSRNNVWVEGVQLHNYVNLAANQFRSDVIAVKVTDGRLTIGIGSAASLATRIDFVEVTATVTSPPPPPTATATKINFQPGAAPTVTGYLVDAGLTFAGRNGQSYGWTTSHAANVVDRDVNAIQLFDTHVGVKAKAQWELAVANGTYVVKVAAGDAAAASTANVWVEGKQLYNYVKLPANQFRTDTITVSVADGRLTLGIGSAGDGVVRLGYVEVTRV